jgi:Tfp pilus assembly protein PilO
MKSTVSIKGMALVLLIFFIGVSLLCYLFLYRPKIIKVVKGTKETASLERRLEGKNQEIKKIREEIEGNKKGGSRDYFNRYQIPPKERASTFLEMHNELVRRLGIKNKTLEPMPQEETPEYIRYPFLVENKSKYEEIVKFVDSLENSLGLNVSDLHIQNDPKDPPWHRLKFTASTFELKDAKPSVADKPSKEGLPPITVRDIVVKRDPFLEKEAERKVARLLPPKKEPKRLPPLKLKATMDFGRNKWALVDDGTGEDIAVREGDLVTVRKGRQKAEYRILEIRENEVIAGHKGEKYPFKLEPLLQTKEPSVKTQKR